MQFFTSKLDTHYIFLKFLTIFSRYVNSESTQLLDSILCKYLLSKSDVRSPTTGPEIPPGIFFTFLRALYIGFPLYEDSK